MPKEVCNQSLRSLYLLCKQFQIFARYSYWKQMRSWSTSSVYRVESLRAMSSDWWVARQRWGLTADSKLSLGSNKLKVGFAAENHFPPSRRPAPHMLPLTRLRKVTSTAEQLSLYHNWTLALGEPSTYTTFNIVLSPSRLLSVNGLNLNALLYSQE